MRTNRTKATEALMDWPMFRRVERQARRMHDMMRRLNANPGTVARLRQGEAYAEARRKCLQCSDVGECLRWLDANPPRTDAPTFCPNLELFESCKKE